MSDYCSAMLCDKDFKIQIFNEIDHFLIKGFYAQLATNRNPLILSISSKSSVVTQYEDLKETCLETF